MSERITAAVKGERIVLPKTWWVRESCGNPAGRWHCLTHNETFDNQFQKDTHIHTGKHHLVWLCEEHGPEQP